MSLFQKLRFSKKVWSKKGLFYRFYYTDAPLLSSLLLPLWAPIIEAAHLLNPFAATPLSSFNWGCSPFESFTATPSSSFNWGCSPFEVFAATPLSFLFCYPFGLSLLLPLRNFPSSRPSSFQWALGKPQLYNSEAMPLTDSVGCHD